MTWKLFCCTALMTMIWIPCLAQEGLPTGVGVNPVVVKIDGQPVRAAEISLVMLNLQAQLRAAGQELGAEQLMEQATQRVIEQRLLAREARRFGLAPDPARVQQMIAAADQQAGGPEQLETNLAAAGSSRTDLTRMIEDLELSRVLIAEQVAPGVEVNDDEAREFYEQHAEFFTRDGATLPFEEVVPQAQNLARQRKTADAVRQLIDRLAKASVIEFTQG